MSFQSVGHLLIAGHFWFGCYYDWYHVNIPVEIADLGDSTFNTNKLKFLTFWNALLQATFFTICWLNDIIGTNEQFPKKRPLIRKIKDLVLPTLTFPLSIFVGLTFWGLYAINRELILPKIIDAFFPTWLNHIVHTNIVIFSLLEMLSTYRKYPPRKLGLAILLIFMLTYLIWIHYIHSYTNTWVYPILNVLNLPARIAFFAMNLIIVVFVYILGEKINTIWWERNVTTSSVKSKKHKH